VVLLIDIGNTRIKWARFERGALQPQSAAVHAEWTAQTLAETILQPGAAAARVLVSNVSGPRMADVVRSATSRTWQVEPEFVTSSAAAGGVRKTAGSPSSAHTHSNARLFAWSVPARR
jgi:type III pantothenate kinase